jgi:ribosomal protein L37AE/L43A
MRLIACLPVMVSDRANKADIARLMQALYGGLKLQQQQQQQQQQQEEAEAAAAGAPPAPAVNCVGGHGLTVHTTAEAGYNCDSCGRKELPEGANLWGCVICDYDVCETCWNQKEVHVPPPQQQQQQQQQQADPVAEPVASAASLLRAPPTA